MVGGALNRLFLEDDLLMEGGNVEEEELPHYIIY
jgi:hypothetical protein